MPDTCCVTGCSNRRSSKNGMPFYRIPKGKTPIERRRRKLWIEALGEIRRDWKNWSEDKISLSRVCGAHFVSGKRSENPEDVDYVPTVFAHSRKNIADARSLLLVNKDTVNINDMVKDKPLSSIGSPDSVSYVKGHRVHSVSGQSLILVDVNGDVNINKLLHDESLPCIGPQYGSVNLKLDKWKESSSFKFQHKILVTKTVPNSPLMLKSTTNKLDENTNTDGKSCKVAGIAERNSAPAVAKFTTDNKFSYAAMSVKDEKAAINMECDQSYITNKTNNGYKILIA